MDLQIPALQGPVFTGREFMSTIDGVVGQRREDAILAEYERGNVPQSLVQLYPIEIREAGHVVTIFVTGDVLAVGTDADKCRTPMFPATAQRIADLMGCMLPTRKMSLLIHEHAAIKLVPHNLDPNTNMVTSSAFLHHNELIEVALGGRRGIVAGHKKDIVLTNLLIAIMMMAIYGWHRLDGSPIQGLSTKHNLQYVDYSHGVRLICKRALLDGVEVDIGVILADPVLSFLLSDEGPLHFLAYPV